MEKSNFDKLLKRYVTSQVSEEERVKIEAWLDVMKTQDTKDLELTKDDEEKLFSKIISNADNIKEIRNFRPSTAGKGNAKWILRIAASLLILSLISFVTWQLVGSNSGFLAQDSDTEKLILNDGSIVWLRGESKLSYYEKQDGTRYSELTGEGLFEVAKDPDHPFIIQCGAASIRVLGTSFNLKTVHDTLELQVLTGKVNLSLGTDMPGFDVLPNEKILIAGKSLVEKQPITGVEVAKVTADTEYNMRMSSVPLADGLALIEKKFDVVIRLVDKKAGDCRISIDLTDHSLESSLQLLSEILDIDYQQNGNTITINGKGCH